MSRQASQSSEQRSLLPLSRTSFSGCLPLFFPRKPQEVPHHPGRPCQRSSAAEPIWGLGEPWLWVRPTGRRLADPRTRYETAKFTLCFCMQWVVPRFSNQGVPKCAVITSSECEKRSKDFLATLEPIENPPGSKQLPYKVIYNIEFPG